VEGFREERWIQDRAGALVIILEDDAIGPELPHDSTHVPNQPPYNLAGSTLDTRAST
jgi:hypothetical protein